MSIQEQLDSLDTVEDREDAIAAWVNGSVEQ